MGGKIHASTTITESKCTIEALRMGANIIHFVFMNNEAEWRIERPFGSALYVIIFGTDTAAGKRFRHRAPLGHIVLSTVAVMLESVKEIQAEYGDHLLLYRRICSLLQLFTIEFALRDCGHRESHWGYVFSFYGIVDILSILPTYLMLFCMVSSQYLRVIRESSD